VRWGNGVQIWPDGARYEGQWENGKANGKGKSQLTKVNLHTSMAISMRVIGRMIKHADSVLTDTLMEPNMLGNGLMITNTGREFRLGSTVANTKGATTRERRTAKVNTLGETVAILSAPGKITKLMGTEFMLGVTEECTKAIGLTIRCMGRENTSGKMAESMLGSTKMTKNMDLDHIFG
jgi:hypothetical protein